MGWDDRLLVAPAHGQPPRAPHEGQGSADAQPGPLAACAAAPRLCVGLTNPWHPLAEDRLVAGPASGPARIRLLHCALRRKRSHMGLSARWDFRCAGAVTRA